MLTLNLQTIDDLIFADARVRNLLQNSFRPIIDQWLISQQMPFLRHLRKQARLDMLNGLTQNHIQMLEEYFDTPIAIDKFDAHVVKNLELTINDDMELCQIEDFSDFSVSRNADTLYIVAWR